MARPIWNGTLSFGLLNIPIALMPGERKADEIHFRMLDARNKAPVRYERVNAETGEEVPWKEIVKAYEYTKGSYVVLEASDLAEAASDHKEVIEMEAFVDRDEITPAYFEKPYVLVPGKKAEKGYVLLRETLKRTGKIGISRVVVRTREYLSAVMPQGDALVLLLMALVVRDILRPEHDLVRQAGDDDPTGGPFADTPDRFTVPSLRAVFGFGHRPAVPIASPSAAEPPG